MAAIDPELKPGELIPAPGGAYKFDAKEFPWWLVGMLLIIGGMVVAILVSDAYQEAFTRILPYPFSWTQGIAITLYLTVGSFVVAIFVGLLLGLARTSKNAFASNTAGLYIEFVRGIPMLVFIFTIALVIAPDFADLINQPSRSIPQIVRVGAALAFFYAAFIAEVFRAGIQSVPPTQREAAKALGLTERQVMRKVVLPQAVRNMLPALGNDLISLMKDTSLVSVMAVREITQMARLYSGSSFRFRESFFILVVLYVILTLGLSLLLRWYEGRLAIPGNLESNTA
ncbi:MAG: amino acid ABC transporter permease [Acidimicrobiia bacterium]|nr:amino acid ABC transporter permease [Acidimicrobiia bacterium]MDH3463996.1 amino acid ABC transporter permease [Acidimicrobiia bacterium]